MTSVGIIGYGSFGAFLHRLIGERFPDVQVRVHSRSREASTLFRPLEEVATSTYVLPCVPISSLAAWYERIVPLLGEASILVDVATVKEYPVQLLTALGGVRFIATHPMFGPYSYEKRHKSLKGLRLVITDHSLSEPEVAGLTSFAEGLGLTVIRMQSEEHDRTIAETLFLTHYIGQVVTCGGFRRTDIDTVSFGFLMDAVESVQNDTELFRDVYMYNRHCREVLQRFAAASSETHRHLTVD